MNMQLRSFVFGLVGIALFTCPVFGQSEARPMSYGSEAQLPLAQVIREISTAYPELEQLYKDLHAHPELSFKEERTSKAMARELETLGFQVTSRVGGYGVVGVFRNGEGPTLMVRTDMDALPIKEDTGLSYASEVYQENENGETLPVMHACGHDMHMSVWVGTARVLTRLKEQWQGTLIFIAQPAEEKTAGARAMIADGLYTRFPRPDYVLGLHVNATLETGKVGYTSGYALANVDQVTLHIYGKGGHGAAPHKTIDPIAIASRIVLALQSIPARALSPVEDPAVLSVGTIHGGNSGNVIPDSVVMELTLRSYGDSTRARLLKKIERTVRGTALAAGVSDADLPRITIREPHTPAVYNDPDLTNQVREVFTQVFGNDHVERLDPLMVGEDFSYYRRVEPGIPTLLYSLGSVSSIDPTTGRPPAYFTHSSQYRPVVESTLKTGVKSMSMALLHLLKNHEG